jgi:ABC-2 type transport system permease protein
LLDEAQLLPPIEGYYLFVWGAILIFVGFVAPEVLCTDRRNGMLGLYLASPLNRNTYLIAKALAVLGILSLVTLGPPLFYLLGLTMNDRGPDGFGSFLVVLLKVVLAGIVVAALLVSLSFAAAATTTRRAAASVAVILILLASATFAQTLVNAAGVNSNLLIFDLLFLPFEVVYRIFGRGHVDPSWRLVSTPVVYGAYACWTVLFATFVWYRYRRLQVTR